MNRCLDQPHKECTMAPSTPASINVTDRTGRKLTRITSGEQFWGSILISESLCRTFREGFPRRIDLSRGTSTFGAKSSLRNVPRCARATITALTTLSYMVRKSRGDSSRQSSHPPQRAFSTARCNELRCCVPGITTDEISTLSTCSYATSKVGTDQ